MRGMGSVYRQRGSRFWWVSYWYGGVRHRQSTGEEKFKVAQDVLKRMLHETPTGEFSSSHPLLVSDLYLPLELDYTINGRKSLGDVKIRWKNHLKDFFGTVPIALVDGDAIANYAARRQQQGAANATINRELSVLKRMYKLAVKARKIQAVPYIPMLEERNVRKGFVKDAQYDALARETAAIGLWLRAMFEIAYTYGWRKAELLEMRVSQADLAERTIALNPGQTKNDDSRLVEMTPKIFELLQRCAVGKQQGEFLFTRDRDHLGRRVRSSERCIIDFRDDWRRACNAANVEGLLFHDLRRSGVRNMRRIGVSEKVAMTISGHKTRSIFERYNIVDRADLHEAVKKLARASDDRRQHEMFTQETLGFVTEGAAEIAPPKKPAAADSQRTAIAAPVARIN